VKSASSAASSVVESATSSTAIELPTFTVSPLHRTQQPA
jgi:hypothetical protein